jgi:hypothetical protein
MVLSALTSRQRVKRYIEGWQAIIAQASGHREGKARWVPAGNFWADFVRVGNELPSVRLGTDQNIERASVEITLPSESNVGHTNALTAVAVDGKAKRAFLVRQGFLRSYRPSGVKDITPAHFKRLAPVSDIKVNITGNPDRCWYVVCDLSASAEEILRQTGIFVSQCAEVRGLWIAEVGKPPNATNASVMGIGTKRRGSATNGLDALTVNRMERRGLIVVPAQEAKLIDKRHAGVWEDLEKAVKSRGLTPTKPSDGTYEVDMAIPDGARKVLIEIKTTANANDVYTAIGQLKAYRSIFPQLKDHLPILLLPSKPPERLRRVLTDNGIVVMNYVAGKCNVFGSELWSTISG